MSYLTDPLLRAPFWGSLLISVAASWMGVILYLQRRILVGELLSHAAYPGLAFGLLLSALWIPFGSDLAMGASILGGVCLSWIGLRAISWMERRRSPTDAALTFILASSFGLGLIFVSYLQGLFPGWSLLMQTFLYGQAATLSDAHALFYGALTCGIALFWWIAFPSLRTLLFDKTFALSTQLPVRRLEQLLHVFVLGVVVVGIRSVGVILMTGMFVAPAIAARCWTERLAPMIWVAGLVGAISGALGLILSVEGAYIWKAHMGLSRFTLPTGPTIVLVGATIAFLSLLLAPKRGLIARWIRARRFQRQVEEEHLLKALWKGEEVSFSKALKRLVRQGWVTLSGNLQSLTTDGEKRAASIVRLHRLWEVYLAELGVHPDQVHGSAEEMEHILTREMEEKLTHLLADPKADPHAQPIPERGAPR